MGSVASSARFTFMSRIKSTLFWHSAASAGVCTVLPGMLEAEVVEGGGLSARAACRSEDRLENHFTPWLIDESGFSPSPSSMRLSSLATLTPPSSLSELKDPKVGLLLPMRERKPPSVSPCSLSRETDLHSTLLMLLGLFFMSACCLALALRWSSFSQSRGSSFCRLAISCCFSKIRLTNRKISLRLREPCSTRASSSLTRGKMDCLFSSSRSVTRS
mmetsp:Transcript_8902/g.19558  ORF Transcript_8902/g.19558 Transcript_8902/m.19558 type:complete len:217 (-) Transcript_8902:555-1205(-)